MKKIVIDVMLVVQMYTEQQLSAPAIAKQLGISSALVYLRLRQHGIKGRPPKGKPIDRASIVELYEDQELSVDETARRLGINPRNLVKKMNKFGIPRRSTFATRIIPIPPKEVLSTLYYERGLFKAEIATHLSVSPTQVGRWLTYYGMYRLRPTKQTRSNGNLVNVYTRHLSMHNYPSYVPGDRFHFYLRSGILSASDKLKFLGAIAKSATQFYCDRCDFWEKIEGRLVGLGAVTIAKIQSEIQQYVPMITEQEEKSRILTHGGRGYRGSFILKKEELTMLEVEMPTRLKEEDLGPMTAEEVETELESCMRGIESIGFRLLRIEKRGGYRALGYRSMEEMVNHRFKVFTIPSHQINKLIGRARTLDKLGITSDVSYAAAKELKVLPTPQLRNEAIGRIKIQGMCVLPSKVKEVVRELMNQAGHEYADTLELESGLEKQEPPWGILVELDQDAERNAIVMLKTHNGHCTRIKILKQQVAMFDWT